MDLVGMIKRFFGNSGITVINSAIATFTKTKEQLMKGCDLCQAEIEKSNKVIEEKKNVINSHQESINTAKKVIENLNKILGV